MKKTEIQNGEESHGPARVLFLRNFAAICKDFTELASLEGSLPVRERERE